MTKQRREKPSGTLGPRRELRLQNIGLEWEGSRGRHPLSVELDLLVEFRRRNGHLAVPNLPEHRMIFEWANEQRRLMVSGKVHPRIRADLIELGFPFTRSELEWERRFASVKGFQDRLGHCCLPPGDLCRWLQTQQQKHRRGSLSVDQEARLAKLDALPRR